MSKLNINIDNICEMATFYQKNMYGDLSKVNHAQLSETKQAYLAGFYESLQFSRKLSPEILVLIEQDLREWFDERIQELIELNKKQ